MPKRIRRRLERVPVSTGNPGRASAGSGAGEALLAAGLRLDRLVLAVLRRRGAGQVPRAGAGSTCATSCTASSNAAWLAADGLRRAADLADVLQRGGVHLVAGGRRLEVVQGPDVSAHATSLPRQTVAVTETEARRGEKVSWAELFFDLVFVVAVTRVSAVLEHDHSWGGLLRALVVFVPIYWLWVGTSIQTNLQDMSRPGLRDPDLRDRAGRRLHGASRCPRRTGGSVCVFALAYWLGRLVLGRRDGRARRCGPGRCRSTRTR